MEILDQLEAASFQSTLEGDWEIKTIRRQIIAFRIRDGIIFALSVDRSQHQRTFPFGCEETKGVVWHIVTGTVTAGEIIGVAGTDAVRVFTVTGESQGRENELLRCFRASVRYIAVTTFCALSDTLGTYRAVLAERRRAIWCSAVLLGFRVDKFV